MTLTLDKNVRLGYKKVETEKSILVNKFSLSVGAKNTCVHVAHFGALMHSFFVCFVQLTGIK